MISTVTLKKQENKFAIFLLASLLLHFLILALLRTNALKLDLASTSKTLEIELVPTENNSEKSTALQIAESSQVAPTETTTDDAYLGKQTQKVDRETRAAQTAPFRQSKPGSDVKNQKQEHPSFKDIKLSDLGVAVDFRPQGHIGPNDPGQVAATSDHLKKLPNGAETMLNTREFAYFTFYQRVRQQLEQFWEPGLKNKIRKMFDRGRQIAADQEHATKLLVVIDSEGVIRRVMVQNTSGYSDLDDAAVDAFNKAGPFPNPPRGMMEKDGLVRVEWEFILRT